MTLFPNVAGKIRKRLAPKVHAFFTAAFSRYLLCTNVVISATLSGLGDVTEQKLEVFSGELEAFDPRRAKKMTLTGATVGVVSHFWYGLLDRWIEGNMLNVVAKKIVVDQVIGSPLCITTFFVTLALFEGQTLRDLRSIREKAMKLYIAEWVIWPPAQFINFYFLPTKYRMLYDNSVSFVYDIYSSYITHMREEASVNNDDK